MYWFLKWNNMENTIESFLETNTTTGELFGIPIIGIPDAQEESKQNVVIISSEKYKDEMKRTAEACGFLNIVDRNDIVNWQESDI